MQNLYNFIPLLNKNHKNLKLSVFMPPTLKKWGHIGYGLSVFMYVCMEVRDIILKLYVWIPHGKIADA